MPIIPIAMSPVPWQPLEKLLQTPGISCSMIYKPLDLNVNKTGKWK